MNKTLPQYLLLIIGLLFLCACSTQNKFAASFGKRHYTKGFYWDRREEAKQIVTINNAKTINVMPIRAKSLQIALNKEKEINRNITMPLITKLALTHKSKLTGFTNIQKPARAEAVPTGASINSYHHSSETASSGNEMYGVLGFVGCLVGIILMFVGVISLVVSGSVTAVGSGGAILLILLGFIMDLAGIVLCIVALAEHSSHQGLAITGIVLNVILLLLSRV
jgi:hypothetical protein